MIDSLSETGPFTDRVLTLASVSAVAGLTLDQLEGKIEFRNLNFSYPSRPDEKVFDNFSLTVPAGKTVAIVGERSKS